MSPNGFSQRFRTDGRVIPGKPAASIDALAGAADSAYR